MGVTALSAFPKSSETWGTSYTCMSWSMLPEAFPNGSILLGQWDTQETSARGEPGGEHSPPASPGEVALGAVGLCPWSGGRCD